MSRDLQELMKELFSAACDLQGDERSAYLDAHCPSTKVRDEVESLLHTFDHDDQLFMASAACDLRAMADFAEATSMPVEEKRGASLTRIGQYRLLSCVGEGGMGTVYKAQQQNPDRIVALKVVRPGLTSRQAIQRFRREANLLGQLHHPGIAHIYEAGELERGSTGQPYFAMEYIDGPPISTFATDNKLSTRLRLELAADICDIVHYAHSQGVVHRDLKPGNILIDSQGRPKILDFGIARFINADAHTLTLQTGFGQLVGTLAYMSPEQITGDSSQIDERSDVYSLGVLTYELLCGRLPYNLRDRSMPEIARIIREDDPSRLSAIKTGLHGDIETVVAKALEKDPARRYQTAAAFADDIRRFLRDETVKARPPSTLYQLRKFSKRNKGLVGGVIAALVALSIGMVFALRFAWLEGKQRERVEEKSVESERLAYRSSLLAALAAIQNHDAALANRALSEAPTMLRGWEWDLLSAYADRSMMTLRGHRGAVYSAVIAPNGAFIASGGKDATLRIWNAHNGSSIHEIAAHETPIREVAISASSDRVATGAEDGIAMWDVASGQLMWRKTGTISLSSHAFHPAAAAIAVARDGAFTIDLVDVETGDIVSSLPVDAPRPVEIGFSADGKMLRFRSSIGYIHNVVATRTGERIWSVTGRDLTFINNGIHAVINDNQHVRLLDAATGAIDRTLCSLPGRTSQFAIDDAAQRLLLVARDETLDVVDVDVEDNQDRRHLHGHERGIYQAHITADGTRIISASSDGTVKLWDALTVDWPFTIPRGRDLIFSATVSARLGAIATGGWGMVMLRDISTGAPYWTRVLSRLYINAIAFNDDASLIAVGGDDQVLHILESATGEPYAESIEMPCRIYNLKWQPGSSRVVVTGSDSVMRVVNIEDASVRNIPTQHESTIICLDLSSDGSTAATGSGDGTLTHYSKQRVTATADNAVHMTDVTTGTRLRTLGSFPAPVTVVRFMANDTQIITASDDHVIARWDISSGRILQEYVGSDSRIRSLTISPDESRLAAVCDDGVLHLWDIQTGSEVLVLDTPSEPMEIVAFVQNGSSLILSGGEHAIVTYETKSDAERNANRHLMKMAREVVSELFSRMIYSTDVCDALRARDELSPELQQAAVAWATGLGDNVNRLNSDAWSIVRVPGQPQREYDKALRMSERICELWPDHHSFLNTLGLAQYRSRRLDAARRTLQRCADEFKVEHRRAHPLDLIVLAMVDKELGREHEAAQLLNEGTRIAALPEYTGNAEIRTILREARTLIEPVTDDE